MAKKKVAKKKKVSKKKAVAEKTIEGYTGLEGVCEESVHRKHAIVVTVDGKAYCVHCKGVLKNVRLSESFKRELERNRKEEARIAKWDAKEAAKKKKKVKKKTKKKAKKKTAKAKANPLGFDETCDLLNACYRVLGSVKGNGWKLCMVDPNAIGGRSLGTVRSRLADAMQALAKVHGLKCDGPDFDEEEDDSDGE